VAGTAAHLEEGVMARSTARGVGGDTPQSIGLQLAMAFGQGAGTMLATPRALMAAFNTYAEAFTDRAESWSAFELRAVEYARALGQVAAWTAVDNGRCIIDLADVRAALTVVQRNVHRPLSLCDLTPGFPKRPAPRPPDEK
jgi:hypothetical protein